MALYQVSYLYLYFFTVFHHDTAVFSAGFTEVGALFDKRWGPTPSFFIRHFLPFSDVLPWVSSCKIYERFVAF